MAYKEKTILNGLSNKKHYYLHKLDNGMKCLLISLADGEYETSATNLPKSLKTLVTSADTLTDKQKKNFSMCLSVSIGSFSDPVEAQGLARLLNGTITKGSERFPVKNRFERFMYENVGSSNAETECDYSSFSFKVPTNCSQEAADLFASMFEAPLLTEKSIINEKQIMDLTFQSIHSVDDICLHRFV